MNNCALSASVATLLPPDVAAVSAVLPTESDTALQTRYQMMLTERTVPKRRQEFYAGRDCAHQALQSLGAGNQLIAIGGHREPVAPAGYRLSISHDTGAVIAIAAKASGYDGIGIDIESPDPIDHDLLTTVCIAQELALAPKGIDIHRFGKRCFVVKEAVFKAIFGFVQTWLSFDEVHLVFSENSRFCAQRICTKPSDKPVSKTIVGRWHDNGERLIAVAWVQA